MGFLAKLFGGGQQPQGPTEAEKAAQRDRAAEANRANADADQNVALASRVAGLRRTLAFRDERKKGTLGG